MKRPPGFYTDLSLITRNQEIGLDALEVFKALSMGETVEQTKCLLVAPNCLQRPRPFVYRPGNRAGEGRKRGLYRH